MFGTSVNRGWLEHGTVEPVTTEGYAGSASASQGFEEALENPTPAGLGSDGKGDRGISADVMPTSALAASKEREALGLLLLLRRR